jgi:DNA modification methylase
MARLAEMHRLLKPTGSLFVHLDWHAVHYVKLALDQLFGPRLFINEIIWAYRTGGTARRHLARKHDTILFYARTPHYKFHPLRERSALAHRYGFANAGVRIDAQGPYRMTRMRDVWEIPALRGNMPERVAFPTQKPLALLERLVALVTEPGDTVGDLFCGSGTALVAALRGGRRALGADLSREALRLAAERLSAAAAPQASAQ